MKENYWIIGELETDMSFIKKQQEQQALKDKIYQREENHQQKEKQQQQAKKDLHWNETNSQKTKQLKTSQPPNLNNQNNNNNQQKQNHHYSHNIDKQINQRKLIKDDNIDRQNDDEKQTTKTSHSFKRFAATKSATRRQRSPSQSLLKADNTDLNKSSATTLRPNSKDRLIKQQQQQQVKKDENEINLSFCGCGFLGIYHVGVASCFHEYAPQLSMHKISGSSAGALIAVSHICGNLQLAYATTDILRVAIDARARALGPFHPSFDINATVREALERGLPEDVHIKASGKLHVSLTRVYDGENVIISQFDSKEDVIQVLLCSCFIPFWSGLVAPKFKGITYIDGGFSNNLLILDDKTVTVSPFAGEADICPQDDTLNLLQISLSNTSFSLTPNNLYRLSHALLPPPPEVLSDLCEQGFADGIRFLQKMNLISCTKCLEIRSSLLVTTNGEDMEKAFSNQVYTSNSLKSTSSFSENHHIRLEQQEQKMIEINGNQRRNSVVSTTSQTYSQQQPSKSSAVIQHSTVVDPTTADEAIAVTAADSTSRMEVDIFTDDEDYNYDLRKQQLLLGDLTDYLSSDDECDDCVLMRQKALRNPLPKQFSDRIRDACDTVNKSLSNWIYSHRPIKYLSYLAAPYYLPIDISLALIYRCWKRLPFIRSEVIDCVYNIIDFLISILKRINSKSSTSSLMGSSSSWEEEAIEYEKEMIRHRQQKKLTTTTTTTAATGTATSLSSSSLSSSSTTTTTVEQSYHSFKIRSDNRQMTTTSSASISSSCLSSATTTTTTTTQAPTPTTTTSSKSRNPSTTQLHSLEDTFDSIVDVTSNQEARIFAYYFRDAKNRLQVTEIFDLQRAAELCTSCKAASDAGNCNAITCCAKPSPVPPPPPQQPQQVVVSSAPEVSAPKHTTYSINQSHHQNYNHHNHNHSHNHGHH